MRKLSLHEVRFCFAYGVWDGCDVLHCGFGFGHHSHSKKIPLVLVSLFSSFLLPLRILGRAGVDWRWNTTYLV